MGFLIEYLFVLFTFYPEFNKCKTSAKREMNDNNAVFLLLDETFKNVGITVKYMKNKYIRLAIETLAQAQTGITPNIYRSKKKKINIFIRKNKTNDAYMWTST